MCIYFCIEIKKRIFFYLSLKSALNNNNVRIENTNMIK